MEKLIVFIDRLNNWINNSFFPWDAYCALMACPLVALDKRPGVRPMGIGETLCRDLDKKFMRASEDQLKTACGVLQLCSDLEAEIESAKHSMGQMIREREVKRRSWDESGK